MPQLSTNSTNDSLIINCDDDYINMVVTKETIAGGVHLLNELLVFNKNDILLQIQGFFQIFFFGTLFHNRKKAVFQLKIYQSPCLPNRTVTSTEYRYRIFDN